MSLLTLSAPARRRILAATLLTSFYLAGPEPIFGQTGTSSTRSAQAPTADTEDAKHLREDFNKLLNRFPPAVGRVLKNDAGLMSNDAYLQPYPELATFLNAHPQIKRNPGYYLESVNSGDEYYYRRNGPWEDMLTGIFVFLVVGTVLSIVAWTIRSFMDYRRWIRQSKIQTEAHTKLLDRFTANDELLAYVQSPSGSQFLQSMPITLEPASRSLGAPFGRILWSVQAGIVMAAAGFGLYWVSSRVDPEATQPLFTLGILALSIGAGFVVSAMVAFGLSKRLGLFEPAPPARTARDAGTGQM